MMSDPSQRLLDVEAAAGGKLIVKHVNPKLQKATKEFWCDAKCGNVILAGLDYVRVRAREGRGWRVETYHVGCFAEEYTDAG